MRNIDPELKTHLESGTTTLCTCWRLTRRDGFVLGFTDHDRALDFDGTVFSPETGATGSALSSSADLSVDNAELEGALTDDLLAASDLAAGRYDGARVEIFKVNWAAPDQRVLVKVASIGEVTASGHGYRAELRGITHQLDQTIGRVYQRLCDVNMGSAPCGVNLDDPAFKTAGTVTAIRDDQSFIGSGFETFEADWFSHGLLTWTSGANMGVSSHIKVQGAGGSIALWLPAGSAVDIGDHYTATAGCDKRIETCRDKYSNVKNFRGFHLMPGNDFAVSYPLRSEDNDGGQRP